MDGKVKIGWEILPGKLYQRGLFPSGYSYDRKLALLEVFRVGLVVQLVRGEDTDLREHAWGSRDFAYVYNPIPDGRSIPDLSTLAKEGRETIEAGQAVLTMCRAGRNRSGLLSGLILKELGYTGEQAIQLIQQQRPLSLYNEHFCDHLRGAA